MNAARPVDGIISYLWRKHGGSIHEKGIVTITSSSTCCDDPRYSATNLADPGTLRVFNSKNDVHQWVHWDFHEMRVLPTCYSIQTHNSPADRSHLKSWVIDGSMDGSSWTELARETNNCDLNGSLMIHSFSISKSIECRFIRLRQTGKNHANNNVLIFYHFDVFGTLSDHAKNRSSLVPTIPSVSASRSSSVVIDGRETQIVINPAQPFEGIISHLSQVHSGNIHEKGIVTITASSIYVNDPKYYPKNLADPSLGLIFNSGNEPNEWVQWDFHEMHVSPTQYCIKTHGSPRNGPHLMSWVIQGSIDGSLWTDLDRRTGNDDLNGTNAVGSFSVSKSIECRFIRLQQTGTNHQSNYMLAFYRFEVFGTLHEMPVIPSR
jgi:hypothetical protein